jgi:hypothetical protein
VEVVALRKHIFLHLVAKMSDRFLEQRMNMKFWVKLGNNAKDTCAIFSDAYRGRIYEKAKRF